MLTFGLYALAYFVFGYIYGKIDNAVYFDNTPTEKISIPKRFIRRLLFPVASLKWEERKEYFRKAYHDNEPIFSVRFVVGAGDIECEYNIKERYCKSMIFLWPLKLLPITCGSVYLTIKLFIFLGAMPYRLLSACVNKAGNLKSLEAEKLPRLSGITAEEAEAEAEALKVADLFVEARKSVEETLGSVYGHKQKLKKNEFEWENLIKTKYLAGADNGRADAVLSALESEIKRVDARADNFKDLINKMRNKEKQLRDAVQEMALLREMASLSVVVASPVSSGDTFVKSDGIAVLMSRNIDETRKLITDAREILKEAEDIKL